MTESQAPRPARSRRWPLLLFCAILVTSLFGVALWRANAAGFVAEAELLIFKLQANSALPANIQHRVIEEDLTPVQMEIVRSLTIIDFAVRKYGLADLKSLADSSDISATVRSMISAERETSSKGRFAIMKVRCRGPIAEDCVAILDAVVQSYSEFLDVNLRSDYNGQHKLLWQARDVQKQDLVSAEERLQKFREKGGGDGDALKRMESRLFLIDQKSIDVALRRGEIESQIATAKEAPNSAHVQRQALNWAAKSFESRPEDEGKMARVVAAYLDHLKGEVEDLNVRESILKKFGDQVKAEWHQHRQTEFEEARLRNEVARSQQEYEAAVRSIQNFYNVATYPALNVRILSGPKVRKASWW